MRRGMGLIIESEWVLCTLTNGAATNPTMLMRQPFVPGSFYATEAGRQHFSDQLTSIRYCVQEVRTAPRTRPPLNLNSLGLCALDRRRAISTFSMRI